MNLHLRRQATRRKWTGQSGKLKCRSLEERTTPTTFTVNTLQDTSDVQGLFSLRDAIHASNNVGGVNTINFAGGLQGTIGLQSALEPIASNLTIDGANVITVGRVPPTVGGDDPPPPPLPKFRIFEIDAGANAMLWDLGVAGGDVDGDGGGIQNNGVLILDGATVRNNSASGDGGGVKNTGDLTVTHSSKIQDNTAVGSGGGITSTGTLGIAGGTISGNSAGGAGGGLYYSKSATLAITNGIVSNNAAVLSGGGISIAAGGFDVILTDTLVTDNRSTGAAGTGGGIFVDNANLTISGGAIDDNSAKAGGGGLFAGGGAILQATGVGFITNQTDANGGAAALEPSERQSLVFRQCRFIGNWSTDLIGGEGGGIYISSESGDLLLDRCTFDQNAAAMGGGFYTANVTDVYGCTFTNNQATVAGGGILGGWADLTLRFYTAPDGTQTANTFQSNQAPQGMGPGIGWMVSGGTLSWEAGSYTGGDIVDWIN